MTIATLPTAAPGAERHKAQRRQLALVAIAALALAACESGEGEPAAADTDATTTIATTTPEPDAPTTVATTSPPQVMAVPAELAVERAEQYLATFGSGDVDAVLGQHTDDFVMRARFPRDVMAEVALGEWLGVVYQTALGTDYADLECEAGEEEPDATVVECTANMVTTIHDETNTPGMSTQLTLTVAADGIAGLESRYLQGLGVFGFYEWRDQQAGAPTGDSSTPEEAAEFGRLESEFADEYRSFGVSTVEQAFAAFNEAELDDFLGRFTRGAQVLGVRSSDAADVYGALMAAGQQYEIGDCEPAGIDGFDLTIDCAVTVVPALGTSGIELDGIVTMDVDVDGAIRRTSDTIDRTPAIGFRSDFEQWLADTHPDAHNAVAWLLDTQIPNDPDLVAPYYEEFIAQSDAYPVSG